MSNVKVAVRLRPLTEKEREKHAKFVVDVTGDTVSVENVKVDSQSEFGDSREQFKHFTFDYCYDSTVEPSSPAFASQELIFQDLGTEVLQAAFEGYNACLFAYGQTSTGKTYTMMGNQDNAGLIPRICEGLFSHVDNFADEENLSFHVKISYLEIYNERVRDLLRPSLLKKNEKYTLKVREHPKEGPYVQDLSTHYINDNQQIQDILERGNEYRTTASTYMHDHSSRSHAIITIEFTQAKLEDDLPHEIVSKLHLVDLAGSERADPTYGSHYKGRLREGANINKSLVTLGNVIKALAERSILSWSSDNLGSSLTSVQSSPGGEGSTPKKRLPYIPYRDSVLTWLLKDSLGGNSKTIMISTISPASIYYNETLSTLRYAQRAKSIINKPKVNEDPNVSLIRELRREIERLREMLVSTHMGNSRTSLNEIIYLMPPSFQKMHDLDTDSEQGDSFLQLPESNSVLAEKLQESETMADKLTQTWIDKWREAHEAIRDSDLSIRGLRGKSNSMGVLIESQLPHLVGMDDDILSTGVTIYYLNEGKTLLGRDDADREQDIVLSGPGVQREHCFIKNTQGNVIIHPNRGANCAINGIDCRGPTRLKQGDYILLGKTNMFRYNNPAEAAKLRISRQNLAVTGATSQESLDLANATSPQTGHVHPIYAHQQMEREFDSDPKRIEEAKRELHRVRDEHKRAAEERQLREEELWRLHESHKHEIDEHRQKLTQIAEENLAQHQRAEEELGYAQECLQQEKDAFQQYLCEELEGFKSRSAQSEFGSQTQLGVGVAESQTDIGVGVAESQTEGGVGIAGSQTEGGVGVVCSQTDLGVGVAGFQTEGPEGVLQNIEWRKSSIQGRIKALAQGELIRSLSYRETEQRLQEEAEEIEDQYLSTQEQLNAELLRLKEVELGYRSGDRNHLQDITRKGDDLSELDRQEEELHLYIEEKQGLMQVGLDRPRPLRTACSEEVLTGTPTSDLGFPFRASSLINLKQGSEGDLPALSKRLFLDSSLNVGSEESIPDSVGSMDTSASTQSSASGPSSTPTRRRSTRSPASDQLTSSAKEVTSRLYKAPPPKFKYEPKQKSSVAPKSEYVRKNDSGNHNISGHSKSPDNDKARDMSFRKSPSPGRQTTLPPGHRTTPIPGRQTSVLTTKDRGEHQTEDRLKRSHVQSPGVSKRARHKPDDSPTTHRLRQSVSQPSLGQDRRLNTGKALLSRLPPAKLRQLTTSATSLASVPEAVGEEGDVMDTSRAMDLSVVRRRKTHHYGEDDTRRHSEPAGDSLADAFEKYTQEMDIGIEIPSIHLHQDLPGGMDLVWFGQTAGGLSSDIPSGHIANAGDQGDGGAVGQTFRSVSLTPDRSTGKGDGSSVDPGQQGVVDELADSPDVVTGDRAMECGDMLDSTGSSVDVPSLGEPTDSECNVNSECDVPSENVDFSHPLEMEQCPVDESVFKNDLEYQHKEIGRSVELDSDSGFDPESSDNFESSGAHSFASSTHYFPDRFSVSSEQDPAGVTIATEGPSSVQRISSIECDTAHGEVLCLPADNKVGQTGVSTDESDVMEGSLISPTDVSLHLSESQDSESDTTKMSRKREHDFSTEDSNVIGIPAKCKKDEYSETSTDQNFGDPVMCGTDQGVHYIPECSEQSPNLNAQFTYNSFVQPGFIVCDILQDAAKTMSSSLNGAQRSYSSDSLEDADSLDGSKPRTAKETELTDSLEDSEQEERICDNTIAASHLQHGSNSSDQSLSELENNIMLPEETGTYPEYFVTEMIKDTKADLTEVQGHVDINTGLLVVDKKVTTDNKKSNLTQTKVHTFSTPLTDNSADRNTVILTKSDISICSTPAGAHGQGARTIQTADGDSTSCGETKALDVLVCRSVEPCEADSSLTVVSSEMTGDRVSPTSTPDIVSCEDNCVIANVQKHTSQVSEVSSPCESSSVETSASDSKGISQDQMTSQGYGVMSFEDTTERGLTTKSDEVSKDPSEMASMPDEDLPIIGDSDTVVEEPSQLVKPPMSDGQIVLSDSDDDQELSWGDRDSSCGHVVSVSETTPTHKVQQPHSDNIPQPGHDVVEDVLVVDSSMTFTPIKSNPEDSSGQEDRLSMDTDAGLLTCGTKDLDGNVPAQIPTDANNGPDICGSEGSKDHMPVRPSTRSLGVVTTLDLLPPGVGEEEVEGGDSDCSHDSLQELQEQVQELEEFPGQLAQRVAGTNGNLPLSSSRRATRHRAMIRQKRRGVDESDDFSPGSDDLSHGSGNVSKPSSRPDSASKRRRRIIKSKSDHHSNLKGPSSDDYINSESDGVCSDDSLLVEEPETLNVPSDSCEESDLVEPETLNVPPDSCDESDPVVTCNDFAQLLTSALDEQTVISEVSDSGSPRSKRQPCDSEDNGDRTSVTESKTDDADLKTHEFESDTEVNMDSQFMNGYTHHDDERATGAICKTSKPRRPKTENGSSTSDIDSDVRPSSRAPSETRDMQQQTDVSWLEFPQISVSPVPRKSPTLNISPLSVWNSGDRGVKASKGPHGSGGLNVYMDSRHIKRTKKTRPVTLEFTSPDVWSADTWIEDYSSSGKLDAELSSDSDDDHAYVMEMEVFSPQSPSACDRFFTDGNLSDSKEDSNSVKYYVTINEENTDITYNIDRTEYKTYSLRSQIQPHEQTMAVPESINIHLTSTNSHKSQTQEISSNTQHVYFNNSEQDSSSPEQNIVVSERSFCTFHEASRDEDDITERHFEEEASASYMELCPGTSTPHPSHISVESEDLPKAGMLSPRESDTTSDYGTMIMDNRRDFTSFTLDSGDEDGSVASGYKSHSDSHGHSPLEDKVFTHELPDSNADLLLAETDSVPTGNSEDVNDMSPEGQNVCSSENVTRRAIIACTETFPCETEFVSNVISQDDLRSPATEGLLVDESERIESECVPHTTNIARILVGALARMSAFAGLKDKNREAEEDLAVSLDRLQGPESESSDSSIYKTPQQSPRDDDDEEDTSIIENVEIPDLPQCPSLQQPATDSNRERPQTPEQKTLSITTDHPPILLSLRRKPADDSSVREELKRELQQKLARLQKKVRSLSDSAISSDYTDGDSTQVSPRGSRLYESDKTLRGGIFIDPSDQRTADDIRVMVTETRTQFDPAAGRPFSSTILRLLDIDNKTPKKSPLKDSGNVFDDSDTGEQVEDTIVPIHVLNKESANFITKPEDADMANNRCGNNTSVLSDSRSLSPGEVMLSASSSDDIFKSVGSGSSDLDEIYRNIHDEEINDEKDYDDGVEPRSLPNKHCSLTKEKSPSMSDIIVPQYKRDLKRSMSEANVDDFEERTTSSESSNDSIVFVFMGQSHTTESMEKLQNEYNPLQYGNYFESVYYPLAGSNEPHPDLEDNTSSKALDHDDDSESHGSIREINVALDSKEASGNVSPDHTGECGQQRYDEEDSEPMRHRFGIDQAVLPMPLRSVSSDNLPKQTVNHLAVHRSRSTDLLDVNPAENPDDPNNNEGIFPPNVDYEVWDDVQIYNPNIVVVEEYYSDDSDSQKASDDVDTLDLSQIQLPGTEKDVETTTEDVMYSELYTLSNRNSPTSDTVDYNGNLPDSDLLDQEEQYVGEFYKLPTPGTVDPSRRPESVGIAEPLKRLRSASGTKSYLTDSSTQTELPECTLNVTPKKDNVLPALASPYRAQSTGNLPVESPIALTLPEGTENWENLSHMVIESTVLLNNINQKMPGVSVSPTSQEMLEACSANTINNFDGKEVRPLTATGPRDCNTQTTGSLTDLQNFGIQTDDNCVSVAREDSPDTSSDSTQTDTDITRPREMSETETTDLIPLTMEIPSDFVFPPEPFKEISCQTSHDASLDTTDSSVQTDEFEIVLSRLSHAFKNDDVDAKQVEEDITPLQVEGIHAQKTLKLSAGHTTSSVQDDAVIDDTAAQHHQNHQSTHGQTQTVIVERESVIETEVNVPNMDVTNAEMECLKVEHAKMMETLKKAAESRHARTQDLKSKLERQSEREWELLENQNSEIVSDSRPKDETLVTTDTLSDSRAWHDTHLSSNITSKRERGSFTETSELDEYVTNRIHTKEQDDNICDISGDLDSIFKESHKYLGSRDSLENIDDLVQNNQDGDNSELTSSKPVHSQHKTVPGKDLKDTVAKPPSKVDEESITPIRNIGSSLPQAANVTVPSDEASRLDSVNSATSEATLLGEEVSQFLQDEEAGRLYRESLPSRSGAKNRTLNVQTNASDDPIDDILSDREGSPRLKTPPNSPIAVDGESGSRQFQKPQPYERTPEVQPNYLAYLRKHPPVSSSNGKVSTGVEVCVDSSDDFTQTDQQPMKLDLRDIEDNTRNSSTRTEGNTSNLLIKTELSRLQKQRIEIIELLSMNYLPASLTVELLEAKLNYCIGQTDTLLKTLEDNWDKADIFEYQDHHSDITMEYVTHYRQELQKSKWDIQVCREKMTRKLKSGTGRGRKLTRNRDIAKWKRTEEIEAFRAERFLEQQNYDRARSISPLKKVSPYDNERHSRSASPSSSESSPRLMTPKQHRDHLVDLRRSLVEVTERDENAYRASRSCSPQHSHADSDYIDRIPSPRSSSYYYSPQNSPQHQRYSLRMSPESHYSAQTSPERSSRLSPQLRCYSPSPSDQCSPQFSPERNHSSYVSPQHPEYKSDYDALSLPDHIHPRSYSHSPARMYGVRSDLYHGSPSYPSARVTSASPHQTSHCSPRRPHSVLETVRDRESRGNDQLYARQETKELFRDMQEARMQNLQEVTRAPNTLLHSARNYSGMRSRTSSNASSRRSYSSYRDYARDLIEGTQRSMHSMVSGSYELYKDNVQSGRGARVVSPPSSVVSDSESLPDSTQNYTTPSDPKFLKMRPINSSDIKSRIKKHKRMTLTS